MELKRYRKWIALYFGVLSFIIILVVIQMVLFDLSPFYNITTNDPMLDFLILFIMISVFSTIGGIFLGYLFGPIYLWFHKKLIGKMMLYGIKSKPNSEKFKGVFIKLFFPALMVMNFSFLLHENLFLNIIILNQNTFQTIPDGVNRMMVITWLFPWASIIALGLFSGAYFLNDAGIIYSNKNKVRNDLRPVELRSVGNWYIQFLKGYAGIAVFLNLYDLISSVVGTLEQSPSQLIILIIFFISWPFMPFILAFLMIPAIIGLDITFERRKRFMLKYAEKKGIRGMIEDPLDQALFT